MEARLKSKRSNKALNNLPDHASAREVMSTDELISLSFTEMLAMKRIVNVRPVGDNQCAEVCGTAGKMVKEFSDNFVNA